MNNIPAGVKINVALPRSFVVRESKRLTVNMKNSIPKKCAGAHFLGMEIELHPDI